MKLTFWGLVVITVDISVNGLDLIHDLVGAVLMVLAVPKLNALRASTGATAIRKRVILLMVVNAVFDGVLSLVPAQGLHPLVWFVLLALGFAWMHQLAVFMVHHAADLSAARLEASWRTTRFVVVVASTVALPALVILTSVDDGNGDAVVLLLAVLATTFAAVIHLLVSLRRTWRGSAELALPDPV
jgi:hypothetical protein